MAVAAQRQVQFTQAGGVTAAKVTDTVVDQRTGLVAQKERIAYEVPNQSGGTTVLLAERVRATRIPNWIHNSTRESRYHQIESGGNYRGSQLGTGSTGVQDTEPKGSIFDLICLPFFAPCAFHLCFVLFWLCTFGIGTLVLIGLTAGGPMQCDHDDVVYNIGKATLSLLLSFLVLMALCCCYGCCNHNKKPGEVNQVVNGIIYCLCTLIAVAFISFLIWSSIVVFVNVGQQTSHNSTSGNNFNNCNGLSFVPIISVSFVYAGSLLFWCCCMCCCFMCLKTLSLYFQYQPQIQPGSGGYHSCHDGSQLLGNGNTKFSNVCDTKPRKTGLVLLLYIFGTGSLVLIGLTAGGPMQCDHHDDVYHVGIGTLSLLVSFFVLMVPPLCYACPCIHKEKLDEVYMKLMTAFEWLYGLIIVAFVVLLIWSSLAVFGNLHQLTSHKASEDNHYNNCNGLSFVPIISVSFVCAGYLLLMCWAFELHVRQKLKKLMTLMSETCA